MLGLDDEVVPEVVGGTGKVAGREVGRRPDASAEAIIQQGCKVAVDLKLKSSRLRCTFCCIFYTRNPQKRHVDPSNHLYLPITYARLAGLRIACSTIHRRISLHMPVRYESARACGLTIREGKVIMAS